MHIDTHSQSLRASHTQTCKLMQTHLKKQFKENTSTYLCMTACTSAHTLTRIHSNRALKGFFIKQKIPLWAKLLTVRRIIVCVLSQLSVCMHKCVCLAGQSMNAYIFPTQPPILHTQCEHVTCKIIDLPPIRWCVCACDDAAQINHKLYYRLRLWRNTAATTTANCTTWLPTNSCLARPGTQAHKHAL